MSPKSKKPPPPETSRQLTLYDQFIDSLAAGIDELPSGPLAERYHQALRHALSLMSRERGAMAALFAAALVEEEEEGDFDLLRGERAERLARAYHRLVLRSSDALPDPKALELAIALYTFHMLVILFWLYDRSPDGSSTQKLLRLTRELFKWLRPLFILPLAPQGIAKLAEIVLPGLKPESVRAAAQDDPRDSEHQNFDIHRD